MRKRVKMTLAVLLLAVIGLLTWGTMRGREPVYERQPLSHWLDRYNRAGDKAWPPRIDGISEGIGAMGTNSLPFLLQYIKHRDLPIKSGFLDFLRRQQRVKFAFYGADPYRETSKMALHVLGSRTAPILPDLLKLSQDPRTCEDGATSLFAIGPMATPSLEKACQSTNAVVRFWALWGLSELKATPPNSICWTWVSAPVNGRALLHFGGVEPVAPILQMLNL